tara:strand:+ start:74 stop:451 length:378 start_codon:yes stop_codon:yes gene_type:complete
MKKLITKTSIDTSVSIANELAILKQHPKVQEYLLLQKKQSTFGSLIRNMIKDFVHVQGIKQPKAIVRPIEDWTDNARFVMSDTDNNNKLILHGLKAKNVVGVTVVPTRPTDANFRVMRSYPKVQS